MPAAPRLTLALTEFDETLLTETVMERTRSARIAQWVRQHWDALEGQIQTLSVDAQQIELVWHTTPDTPEPALYTVRLLLREQWAAARVVLGLLRTHPAYAQHPGYAYQLGRVYTELHLPARALPLLELAVQGGDTYAPGHAALGWVHLLLGHLEAALTHLRHAAQLEPDNPWIVRQLGRALVQAARLSEGLTHLHHATELAPDDTANWYALAQALEWAGDLTEAEAAYDQVITVDEFHPRAELARAGRSRLAQVRFRAGAPTERLDAVMYCLGALRRYATLTPTQAQALTHEIALQGAQGFDLDNAIPHYTVRAFPGETFTGLNLVCLLYVGFKHSALKMEVGFDLEREYTLARHIWESAV